MCTRLQNYVAKLCTVRALGHTYVDVLHALKQAKQ